MMPMRLSQIPGLTIMKDVAIAKSEFNPDESAITKIQNFQVWELFSLTTYNPLV